MQTIINLFYTTIAIGVIIAIFVAGLALSALLVPIVIIAIIYIVVAIAREDDREL